MLRKILVFSFILLSIFQIGKTDNADDAEAALDLLRQATTEALNSSFIEHIAMSVKIENAALDTKDSGTKEISKRDKQMISSRSTAAAVCYRTVKKVTPATGELAACVDKQAEEAHNYLYNAGSLLVEMTFKTLYDKETEIVFCGRSDVDCLNGVTDEIKEKIDELVDLVAEQVEEDRRAVDVLIGSIAACADETVAKVDRMMKMCQI